MTYALHVLTVSDLNRYLKELLAIDDLVSGLWLRGEASNVTRHASGHLYFTLKDADSQLSAVMWRGEAQRLRFPVEAGAQYLAHGRMALWEKRGTLQFTCDHLEPDGLGALHVAYERLKARLETEGLFDPSRKRPLPYLPRRIALVTSPTGAAIHDMVRILRERHPRIDLVIVPALVQGDGAPASIVSALAAAGNVPDLDLIIVGRGGGSLEDLWAFNDEKVVRAIAASPVAVISAIGHETDSTLADFVADCRAPTPTAAAQLAVPIVEELHSILRTMTESAVTAMERRLNDERARVAACHDRAAFAHPVQMAAQRRKELDSLALRLGVAAKDLLLVHRQRMAGAAGQLHALSPLAVLSRGYALVRKDGRSIHSIAQVGPGDSVEIRLADGAFDAVVGHARAAPNGIEREEATS